MDSTDEKMHKKMQLIQEAEAKEYAKKQQREIAKRKLDPGYNNNQKSMSSADYSGNSSLASSGAVPGGLATKAIGGSTNTS
jgi:hypothetical protein